MKSKLTLERVLGITSLTNASVATNPAKKEIAYAAGCIVVVYNLRRHRQMRYFRAGKAISCIAFSPDGKYLAVGERGHLPSINVWNVESGNLVTELKGHKYGVACVAFGHNGRLLVSVGFQYDHHLYAWDFLHKGGSVVGKQVAYSKISQKVHSIGFSGSDQNYFVTVGDRHVKVDVYCFYELNLLILVLVLGRKGECDVVVFGGGE